MKIPLREIEAVEKLPGRYSKVKVEQVLGMLKILPEHIDVGGKLKS